MIGKKEGMGQDRLASRNLFIFQSQTNEVNTKEQRKRKIGLPRVSQVRETPFYFPSTHTNIDGRTRQGTV